MHNSYFFSNVIKKHDENEKKIFSRTITQTIVFQYFKLKKQELINYLRKIIHRKLMIYVQPIEFIRNIAL